MTTQQEHDLYLESIISMLTSFLNNLDNEEATNKTLKAFKKRYRLNEKQECAVRLALFSLETANIVDPSWLTPDNEQSFALIGVMGNTIADILMDDWNAALDRMK